MSLTLNPEFSRCLTMSTSFIYKSLATGLFRSVTRIYIVSRPCLSSLVFLLTSKVSLLVPRLLPLDSRSSSLFLRLSSLVFLPSSFFTRLSSLVSCLSSSCMVSFLTLILVPRLSFPTFFPRFSSLLSRLSSVVSWPLSLVPPFSSLDRCLSSLLYHPSSFVFRPFSFDPCLLSLICRLLSFTWSLVPHLSSLFPHLSPPLNLLQLKEQLHVLFYFDFYKLSVTRGSQFLKNRGYFMYYSTYSSISIQLHEKCVRVLPLFICYC
jgi:hypothetical protein